MAGNTLENLERRLKISQLPVKYGKCGSRKMLDGFILRLEPLFPPKDFLNGVQEVAGSNPVAPTFARLTGTRSCGEPCSFLKVGFRPVPLFGATSRWITLDE